MLCKNCGRNEAQEGGDYCRPCEELWFNTGMTKDEQEALSRAHSDDVIRLLPLSSGSIAVFNNARDLCGIIEDFDAEGLRHTTWREALEVFKPPKKAPAVDLEELGLL